jgi:N-acetylglutamate synthase
MAQQARVKGNRPVTQQMGPVQWPPSPEGHNAGDRDLLIAGDQVSLALVEAMVRARPGFELELREGFYLRSFRIPTEELNEVVLTRKPADPATVVNQACRYFEPRSPRWRLVCPPEWESLMDESCLAASLDPVLHTPIMILTPDNWRTTPPVENLVCRRVEDMPSLKSFGETFSRAFGFPNSDFWDSRPLLKTPGLDLIVGSLDDVPVSTGFGYTFGGITGVWGIATCAEYRGRGIGSAITWAVVTAGQRWGAEAAYLWATQMGFPVYRKMGFRHIQNQAIWVHQPPKMD